MTDRVRTLTVILDDDYRNEDESVGVIMQAIRMVKGVSDVEAGDVVQFEDHAARNDYRRRVGLAISALALNPDKEYLLEVQASYEKMKSRRGY
ncbi:hypothetical protein Poly59_30770 [Rubripirellula reticaptiva]|uniref:Uncharacterized protein n=1 Tax=Rubripirellula reticaptiva TaxID=2528013 RepID=A0A5C6ES65_9BACT|nr:hypothetical protein Poly59_30770 [Rubripirellula reticaptiva]